MKKYLLFILLLLSSMDGQAQNYRVVLDPLYQTKLYPEILKMRVEKIQKRMGESFEKGDVLIQMDKTVLEANLLKAEAEVASTRTQLEALQKLYEDEIISDYELANAEAEYKKAIADLAFAKKNLEAATIRAPYDGKVQNLNIEEHELPIEDQELIEIIHDKVLLAHFLVTSDLLKKIYIGKPVVIHVQETGRPVVAKITRIGAMIDPASSTIKVEAQIDNKDDELKAGMTGRVAI